jgi:ABC-type sugar transport system ATPase subunit
MAEREIKRPHNRGIELVFQFLALFTKIKLIEHKKIKLRNERRSHSVEHKTAIINRVLKIHSVFIQFSVKNVCISHIAHRRFTFRPS